MEGSKWSRVTNNPRVYQIWYQDWINSGSGLPLNKWIDNIFLHEWGYTEICDKCGDCSHIQKYVIHAETVLNNVDVQNKNC